MKKILPYNLKRNYYQSPKPYIYSIIQQNKVHLKLETNITAKESVQVSANSKYTLILSKIYATILTHLKASTKYLKRKS